MYALRQRLHVWMQRRSRRKEIEEAGRLLAIGTLTVNEIRELQGLSPISLRHLLKEGEGMDNEPRDTGITHDNSSKITTYNWNPRFIVR